MAARKPVTRAKKVIDLETYSALDAFCISLHEYYKALRRAGFSHETAFWLILEKESFPDWILPVKPIEKITGNDYEDDDD
jgi:hypothetical protein